MKKIVLLILAITNIAYSQTVLLKPFETKVAKATDEHLKNYNLLQLNVKSLINQIDAIKGNVKEFVLRTPEKSWNLQLFEYTLVAPGMKRVKGDPLKPTHLPERKDFRSFNGTIKGTKSMVSMSIADGFFKIMIDDGKDRYFIEPLDNLSLTSDLPASQQFLLYKSADVVPTQGISCGAEMVNKSLHNEHERIQKEINSRARPCKKCVEVKIALAADYSMFLKYGSVAAAENQMLSVLGDVQTVFDNEFEHEYVYEVTGLWVSDDFARDPWAMTRDIATQLTEFANIAPTIFATSQYNVATLWTSKFTTGVIGIAYLATVCMNDRYNVCSDYLPAGGKQADYLTLQAHELGHNWSMIHDAGIASTIMAPTINGSSIWSTLSTSYLNNYVNFQHLIESQCLQICAGSDAPVPDFIADVTYGCQPVTVKFKDLSLNASTWKWSFPGGTPASSSIQNPIVIYRTPGIYEVSLEAGNSRCEVLATKISYIEINDVPVASFSYGNQGREVFFIDQSLRADEYFWKFGDGETSEEANPYHEYETDSTFEVTLTVKNDCGVHTIKKKISIVSIPTADFDSDTIGGCAPRIIKFFDQSTKNVKTWQWEFVGGVPSVSTQKNPIVRYDNPGVYDVRLTVYASRFNHSITKKVYITIDSLPDAEFTNSETQGQVDFTNQSRYAKSHFWNFGDNTTSTQANPSHKYLEGRYEVLYIVSNACGNDTARTTITIGTKPIAGFQVNEARGCVPYQVQFQNTSTASAVFYKWYFPGGSPSTSTDQNPVITYNAVGKYNVSLVAYNNFYTDSVAKTDFIEVKTTPTSLFSNSISGFKSTFVNQGVGGTNFFWDFGDTKGSFELNPVHDYNVEGEFDVRLIVQNECGLDTFDKHIAVYLVPKVNYTADTIKGCAPLTVNFKDKSSIDVIEWDWLFENGTPTTSNVKNPVVVFNKKGKYTVKLTVKNTNGTNALTKTQYIQVLSPVLCPEHTKTSRFNISDLPFGGGFKNRADDFEYELPIVFPNPAKEYILVATDASQMKPINIDVFDLSGKKLSSHLSKEQLFKIQTEQLKSGTYYIRMNDGTNSNINKFVISE
ncbi:MAG: PKD domain-containing protein [Saprospiraceae bacterium]